MLTVIRKVTIFCNIFVCKGSGKGLGELFHNSSDHSLKAFLYRKVGREGSSIDIFRRLSREGSNRQFLSEVFIRFCLAKPLSQESLCNLCSSRITRLVLDC
jgi:hypothetical protein